MISNPSCGWCNFKLGDFTGNPSYLTDVPVDLLDAFINYHKNGYGVVVFNEEGSTFTFIITKYNWGIFVIEEKNDSVLYDFSKISIDDLEKELIDDIEKDIEGWSWFITDNDILEIVEHKKKIQEKLKVLKEYRYAN